MLDALGCMMSDLSRFAADIVFFTTSECGFFTIEKGYTTGSSTRGLSMGLWGTPRL